METEEQKDGFLGGIRVLDLADEKASFCSKLLADMGAYVIKVEKPGGDSSRKFGPFYKNPSDTEISLSFFYNNTNKHGITLDLENAEGREIFAKLVKPTDIIVEAFPPGYLEGLGLGFEILSEINRRLILVSVSGFGGNGPRRHYKTCDLVASAFGGQMYVTGCPSVPPLKAFGEQAYYAASLFAAIGSLLAVRRRNQTGKGEHIDISIQEAVVSTLEHVMVQYFYYQTIPKRQGRLHRNNAFCILPCRKGHILLTLSYQWGTFVELMESEGMAEDLMDEKWNNEEYRLKYLDHIMEVSQKWTRTHTAIELFNLGQLMQFPWTPVQCPKEVLDSSQLKARGFFMGIDHPEIGAFFKYPGMPYKFSSSMSKQSRRAPLIGEHNVRIYQEELGLVEKEMKRLSSEGII